MRSFGVLASRLSRLCRSNIACAAATLAIVAQAGCDAPSSPNGPPLPSGIVVPKTPEEKLERVMERMSEALADAQAARGVGVVSERTCEHRLIPPEGEDGKYRAEITIRTKIMLASAPAAETLIKRKKQELAEAEEEKAASEDEKLLKDDEELKAEEGEEAVFDNGVTSKAIAQSKEQKVEVYQLAYEDERWKLVTEPKNDTDKLILDFALDI
jgi:hypothetical protein